MQKILTSIVSDNNLHCKWINTLSYMENCGARKISACEQPQTVQLMQLKHAAEEHRHAYYLKKQLLKFDTENCKTYAANDMLASLYTRQYLHQLDIKSSRFIKEIYQLEGEELRYASYLFVTYAIEVRADELYPIYQNILTELKSKVMVKSIILEEEGHLEEMTAQLEEFDTDWKTKAELILAIEDKLFIEWFEAISKEVLSHDIIS